AKHRQYLASLRSRVLATFIIGAVLFALLMSSISYFTVRHFLITERQATVLRQSFTDAALMRPSINQGAASIREQISAFDEVDGVHAFLLVDQKRYRSNPSARLSTIPLAMRKLVRQGNAATQTFLVKGEPTLGVGIRIASAKASFFVSFSVSDIARTLRALLLALIGISVLLITGAAFAGLRAARRAVRPLAQVGQAASAIASGDLSARLAHSDDRDLAALTDSFNTMASELETRIARDAAFDSNVAHELRSPLTTLSATVEILQGSSEQLSSGGREALELLSSDLNRFRKLIADLLELAADNERSGIRLEAVNAAQLVRKASEANLQQIDASEVELVIAEELEDEFMLADKRRVERIFANLIGNASAHSDGLIAIEANRLGDGFLEIAFIDRGPAIAIQDRARIFDRFYRGSASGRRADTQGSGLGLALVSEHVAVHAGSVTLSIDARGGNCFTVLLPLERASPL
ncbi:MAG: HAMP domain-containing sensor histidine kinase, partial [Actinobacteria bacterium]|nr:HAMP domain-containing sensor histidine kinase [Actinomycetota bacterium]